MKKIMFAAILSIASLSISAQQEDLPENTLGDNELKINVTNLVIFKWLDVGYEKILNEESSVGVGLLFALDNDDDISLDEYRTFSLTPYYRHFFGKKYAQGFFVEGFTMLHSGKGEYDNNLGEDIFPIEETYTDFAVGISIGTKIVSRRGFVAEIYGGIGRDLLNKSDVEVVGRGGISLGYRF
ncbi:MAG: hypothetical protein ACI87F_000871 [Candidatus Azotimanducaceae bacterium]|jgi:hypothetical protein